MFTVECVVMQLQKSSEEREGKVEELSQELKAARKEIGRLQPLEQRVKDLLGNLKQTQIDKDRYLSMHHFCSQYFLGFSSSPPQMQHVLKSIKACQKPIIACSLGPCAAVINVLHACGS